MDNGRNDDRGDARGGHGTAVTPVHRVSVRATVRARRASPSAPFHRAVHR
jgi:hypothetical protein